MSRPTPNASDTPLALLLDDARATSRALTGGKGASLARLRSFGLRVPVALCLTTAAFREALFAAAPRRDLTLADALRTTPIPNPIIAALRDTLRAAGFDDTTPLAVRSSALNEDAQSQSSAGQYLTVLNVRGEPALHDAIRACWASLFSERALLQDRDETQLDDASLTAAIAGFGMAVVIQRLVEPHVSGVLFTANPVNGDRTQMMVCSAYGLGERVVGGESADTFTLDADTGTVIERHIAVKEYRTVTSDAGGTRDEPLPEAVANAASLTPRELAELAALGRRIADHYGAPQDIEFALHDGLFTVLQSRAITTLAPHAAKGPRTVGNLRARRSDDPTFTVWTNANVGEALPGVGTPITWSIIRRFSRMGFVQAFGSLGLTVPEEYQLVGSFRGRVYLNLTEFMSVASQIPVFNPERLMALAGGEVLPGLSGSYRRRSKLGFVARLPLTMPRVVASQFLAPRDARDWMREFAPLRDAFFREDLTQLTDAQLDAKLTSVTEIFNRTGTAMLACASNALSTHVAVQVLVGRWGGESGDEDEALLYTGLSGLASAEPGFRLLQIAGLVRRHNLDAVFDAFADSSRGPEPAAVAHVRNRLANVTGGTEVLTAIDAFIAEFGLRAPREAEISTPRWREDPAFIYAIVRSHLRSSHLPDPAELERRRHAARRRAEAALRARLSLVKRPIFDRALAMSQEATRLREAMRACVVDTLSMYRHLFLEVGRRYLARNIFALCDDIFFLTIDEVHALLRNQHMSEWCARVRVRRTQHEAFVRAPDPPPDFQLRSGEIHPPRADHHVREEKGQVLLVGLAGSPGIATGPARVVADPRAGASLLSGEILVARYTDVGWTPMFLLAAAVVADLGGPLSHSCIVAREYGIPCVVNVRHGVERINDGDLITVDGHKGIVYLRKRAEG